MDEVFTKPVSIGNIAFSPDERKVVFATLGYDSTKEMTGQLWLYDRETGRLSAVTEPGDCPPFVFLDDTSLLFSEYSEKDGIAGTAFCNYSLTAHTRREQFFLPIVGLSASLLSDNLYLLSGSLRLEPEKAGPDAVYQSCSVITRAPYQMDGAGDVQGYRSHLWLYRPEWDEPRSIVPEIFQCAAFCWDSTRRVLYISGEEYDVTARYRSTLYALDPETLCCTPLCQAPSEIGLMAVVGEILYAYGYDLRGNGAMYRLRLDAPQPELIKECDLEGDLGWCLDTDIALLGGCSFSGQGDKLWMIYSDPTGARICTYKDGVIEPVSPEGYQVRSFAVSPGNSIFAVCLEGYWPLELFELRDGNWIRRSSFNACLPREALSLPVSVPYQNRCGQEMLGWLIPPRNHVPGTKAPGFLMIHEGPQGRYEAVYHSDMQFLAGLGYFVFFTNPRGGSCVSRAFADLEDRMGTIDYEDLMDFTDAVLAFCPDMDSERLAVGGISYGGFMTNWIIGHTDRFHTAVSNSSISNWTSLYGTMDMPYCVEYGSVSGKPWTNWAGYWRSSPLASVDRVKTPTLFIQGEDDFRCPLSQAQQMFCCLQQQGIQARLIQYPNASHNFGYYGTYAQRLSRYEQIARWLTETNQKKEG